MSQEALSQTGDIDGAGMGLLQEYLVEEMTFELCPEV